MMPILKRSKYLPFLSVLIFTVLVMLPLPANSVTEAEQALDALDDALNSTDQGSATEDTKPLSPSISQEQSLTPPSPDFSGPEKILLKMESNAAVANDPSHKTMFTLLTPAKITKIWTYHYNHGRGAAPGTIGLRESLSGTKVGSWPAMGSSVIFDTRPGSIWPSKGNQPPYLYLAVQPDIVLEAGTYEVIDSDISTWSHNADTGFRGCAWVYGVPGK